MPPPKKRVKSSKRVKDDSDDDIVESNSEVDSEAEAERAERAKPGAAIQDKDLVRWELGDKKRVTISTFKGKTYVGLREYYEKDGKLLPGKKGLNLTVEQYKTFASLLGEIDKKLGSKEK